MSLDIYLTKTQPVEVYSANITHNLRFMAKEAGIYDMLWHPEETGIHFAKQLTGPLQKAIFNMEADPERFKKFNVPNVWGLYEYFIPWLKELLEACKKYPDAKVSAWT